MKKEGKDENETEFGDGRLKERKNGLECKTENKVN